MPKQASPQKVLTVPCGTVQTSSLILHVLALCWETSPAAVTAGETPRPAELINRFCFLVEAWAHGSRESVPRTQKRIGCSSSPHELRGRFSATLKWTSLGRQTQHPSSGQHFAYLENSLGGSVLARLAPWHLSWHVDVDFWTCISPFAGVRVLAVFAIPCHVGLALGDRSVLHRGLGAAGLEFRARKRGTAQHSK